MLQDIPISPSFLGSEGQETEEKLARLRSIIRPMKRVVVAVSGGVDSVLQWRVATDELGANALGVTAVSPSLASWEKENLRVLIAEVGGAHRFVETDELQDSNYAANPPNRCYFCKRALWQTLSELAQDEGYYYLLAGDNLDDVGDFRPGQQAGRESGVRSPLREAGFTKADIRATARMLGLSIWNKPAMACLASRFSYGVAIDATRLGRVDRAERWLRQQGLTQVRVRVHGDEIARIEVPQANMATVFARRTELVPFFKELGFAYVTLDLEGFRSGSMNEVLTTRHAEEPRRGEGARL